MHVTDILSGSSGAAWLPFADAILKATLLFASAALASLALRRATAAARHLVWTLALVSAIALPALSLALPRWQLPVVRLASTATAGNSIPNESPALSTAAPGFAARPRTSTPPVAVMEPGMPPDVATVNRSAAAGIAMDNLPWRNLLLAAWSLGAALILLRLVTGLVGVQWLSRRTVRVNEAPWLPLARTLAGQLGLPSVVFRRSARATMPMACGIVRPAVLMPADADGWPAERLRIVLLHELAHVKRRDCLTHMLAQISCALYWFNPLVWVAARHLRTERERACDDLVLAAGTRGADYADQLLEIARRTRSGRFPRLFGAATVAMAQRSQLEGRLMAILDPTVPRSGVSRFRTIAASSMFAFAVVPLASVQPWTIEAPGDPGSTVTLLDDSNARRRGSERAANLSGDRAVPGVDVQRDRAAGQADAGAVSNVPVVTRPAIAPSADIDRSTPLSATAAPPVVAPLPQPIPVPAADAQTNADAPTNAREGKERPADPRTIAALRTALKDTDKGVRDMALHALVQMRDPGVFDPLVQALGDGDTEMREQAASALGQMRDRRAVEPLSRALKDQNAEVREQAASALGQLRDRAAVGALTSALKDADDDVREQAAFALGQLRDPAAVEALAAAMRDAKVEVREQVVFALGQLRDRRAVEPLVSALKDADPDVREQAAFALGQIRDVAAVEALVIALKDSVADVRAQVAFALGQMRDPRAIDALTAALKDASAEVRQHAAFALGQLAR